MLYHGSLVQGGLGDKRWKWKWKSEAKRGTENIKINKIKGKLWEETERIFGNTQ